MSADEAAAAAAGSVAGGPATVSFDSATVSFDSAVSYPSETRSLACGGGCNGIDARAGMLWRSTRGRGWVRAFGLRAGKWQDRVSVAGS
eukprot:4600135-Pleurochrysis_carterae.AAC.1